MTSTGGDVEPLENLLPCYIELLDKHVKPPSCAAPARPVGGGPRGWVRLSIRYISRSGCENTRRSPGSAVGDWLWDSNPMMNGRRMCGSQCEQCVAMGGLPGSQEKHGLKGGHQWPDSSWLKVTSTVRKMTYSQTGKPSCAFVNVPW